MLIDDNGELCDCRAAVQDLQEMLKGRGFEFSEGGS
jgi:hypothetical protein